MLLGLTGLSGFWKCRDFRVVVIFFLVSHILLTGCYSDTSQGRFELEMHSSFLFGDISIPQGKSGEATVAINRKIERTEYQPDINMSLIDPPSWLNYSIENNPVSGDSSSIKLDIAGNATPGIYRLVLYGVGDKAGRIVDDSVTFHLVVEQAEDHDNTRKTGLNIREKLFSLFKS
jgi:hypothetical protein